MIWYVAFIVLRLLVTGFFLVTSLYSALNYSPFTFNQFLRPRLFGWVNEFVSTHHLWYCGAYLLSVVTLWPQLRRPDPDDRVAVLARRLAFAYVVVFGLVGERLLVTPYLPTLWNDGRSLAVALLSFVPLVWLAVIDHVAARPHKRLSEHPQALTDQRRMLVACLVTAEYLWVLHLIRAMRYGGAATGTIGWIFMACWTQAINLTAAMVAYVVLTSVTAIASCTRVPRACEYVLAVALAAAAASAVLLEIVFPNLAFGEYAPTALAVIAGAALALTWSSAAVRRPRGDGTAQLGGIDLFVAPLVPTRTWLGLGALVILPVVTFGALDAVAGMDWNFLIQKVIVVAEWVLAFGFVFGAVRGVGRRSWSPARAVAPPLGSLLLLLTMVRVSAHVPVWTGNPQMEAEVSLDRYAGVDLSFKLLYDGLIQHPGRDARFYRYLQANTSVPLAIPLTPPDVRFFSEPVRPAGSRPHVFLFVVDSLRRDYLSPFNAAVTFTPNIASFASESFAFHNAFSHYGGTFLAVPSLWSGGLLIHRTSFPTFTRSNALGTTADSTL